MAIPAGNVRPQTWVAGTVEPNTTTGDLGIGESNSVFVITSVSLWLPGAPGETMWCQHQSHMIASIYVPEMVGGLPVPGFINQACESTLDLNWPGLLVSNNSEMAIGIYEISGYFWCVEEPRI